MILCNSDCTPGTCGTTHAMEADASLPAARCTRQDPGGVAVCAQCSRGIVRASDGSWIDPEATGDDSIWSQACEASETFTAEHIPG